MGSGHLQAMWMFFNPSKLKKSVEAEWGPLCYWIFTCIFSTKLIKNEYILWMQKHLSCSELASLFFFASLYEKKLFCWHVTWPRSTCLLLTIEVSGFPCGSAGKASAYNAGDLGSIPGSGSSPGEGNGSPHQVFLPGKSHGRRSPVGYSPWGHKESDTTEGLHLTEVLGLFSRQGWLTQKVSTKNN